MKLIPKLTRELKDENIKKRVKNIDFIYDIPRDGLSYGQYERQMFFAEFYPNELVSIQYPGKESSQTNTNIRPYDFRPKLQLSNGDIIPDLSFKNIWDSLIDLSNTSNNIEILKLLSCEFFRIAFMIDYQKSENLIFTYRDINTDINKQYESSHKIYLYTPNNYIITLLQSISPKIYGASWEAFFMYNDLLALNEDCKYFYNNLQLTNDRLEATKYIKSGTGRVNTMLSHIHVLAFITGDAKLTDLMNSFLRYRGACPISKVNDYLKDYMYI